MKKVLVALVMLTTASAFADEWVDGYTKADGTYVPGHYRTDKNETRNDNYSTQGNYNPYTGKKGTKKGDGYYPTTPSKKKSTGYNY